MPPREDENPDLNPLCAGDPLARHLAALQPLPPGLNRDQLLYAAGAAARDRDVAFWRRLFAGQCAALCAAVGVGIAAYEFKPAGPAAPAAGPMAFHAPAPPAPLAKAPAPRPVEEEPSAVPSGPPPGFAAAGEPDPAAGAKWLQLRADVFAAGLGVLPTPAAPPPPADATALEQSLELPRGVLAAPHARPKNKSTAEGAEGAEEDRKREKE